MRKYKSTQASAWSAANASGIISISLVWVLVYSVYMYINICTYNIYESLNLPSETLKDVCITSEVKVLMSSHGWKH